MFLGSLDYPRRARIYALILNEVCGPSLFTTSPLMRYENHLCGASPEANYVYRMFVALNHILTLTLTLSAILT